MLALWIVLAMFLVVALGLIAVLGSMVKENARQLEIQQFAIDGIHTRLETVLEDSLMTEEARR